MSPSALLALLLIATPSRKVVQVKYRVGDTPNLSWAIVNSKDLNSYILITIKYDYICYHSSLGQGQQIKVVKKKTSLLVHLKTITYLQTGNHKYQL